MCLCQCEATSCETLETLGDEFSAKTMASAAMPPLIHTKHSSRAASNVIVDEPGDSVTVSDIETLACNEVSAVNGTRVSR